MTERLSVEELRKMNKRTKGKKEESLQIMVAEYLRVKYPDVIFSSDFAAGCKLTIGQAVRNKKMQCGKKYPDMFIAEPVRGYSGLYLELKKEGTKVFKADGTLYANEHLKAQYETLQALRAKGYKAVFAIGYDSAIRIIQNYMILGITATFSY
jgi:hypothetical protein